MYRTTTLCMALLISSGSAVADDAASADKAPSQAAGKQADAGTGKATVAGHGTPDGGSKAAAVAQQDGLQGTGLSGADPKQGSGPSGGDPAQAVAGPAQPGGPVKMSGMSILGNEEAPKSLVIVPWKSSQLGDMPGVARLLDSSTQPVDKDVFMRELAYYEIRSKAQ
jgi:hypothetical protein